MNKNYRTLIIIISAVIISVAALTVYFLSRQTAITPVVTPPTETGNGSFPTSQNTTPIETGANNTDQNPVTEINQPATQGTVEIATFPGEIRKTTDVATGGMTLIEKDRNGVKTTYVRYIERGTGHIKEIAFDENIPANVTNTTITGIYDSVWNKDGSALIIRRLDGVNNNIQMIYGTIGSDTGLSVLPEVGVNKLDQTILPSTVLDVVVSPQKDKLFYLVQNGELTEGAVSDFKGATPFSKKLTIWSSPISEWQIMWPKQDQIMLLTKPAYNVSGFLYSLTVPKNNVFEKMLGDIAGLTAVVSPSGKKIIYSESVGSGLTTYYLNKQSGEIKVFPVKTLPEKCVWSNINENIIYCGVPKNIIGSTYPDSWYKGIISFNDDIYRIDLDVNSGRKLNAPSGAENIDATRLLLSPQEDYLSFINKKDGTVWTTKLR